eukprot:SM000139S00119  [mRNA]  locus=s139:214876:218231:+ [translate_table: standard]
MDEEAGDSGDEFSSFAQCQQAARPVKRERRKRSVSAAVPLRPCNRILPGRHLTLAGEIDAAVRLEAAEADVLHSLEPRIKEIIQDARTCRSATKDVLSDLEAGIKESAPLASAPEASGLQHCELRSLECPVFEEQAGELLGPEREQQTSRFLDCFQVESEQIAVKQQLEGVGMSGSPPVSCSPGTLAEAQESSQTLLAKPLQDAENGSSCITDFFRVQSRSQTRRPQPPLLVRRDHKKVSKKQGAGSAGHPGFAPWQCIPGTSFRVDAFQHGKEDCTYWFLTHFHMERKFPTSFLSTPSKYGYLHTTLRTSVTRRLLALCNKRPPLVAGYQGLTRSFKAGMIVCSQITSRLVQFKIGIAKEKIMEVDLGKSFMLNDTRVTFLEANHCPGAVMILFEPPDGKAVLHTGDFRFCPAMLEYPALKAVSVHTLILDTTFCQPQYDFPKQDIVIQYVTDAILVESFNPRSLFLIGTHLLGREKLFLNVAQALRKKLFVSPSKQRLLDCMGLSEEDKTWLVNKETQSNIHVVPMWSIASFKRIASIARHYHGRFDTIVGISPSSCTLQRSKKRAAGRRWQQGTLVRYEVPYVEHSSFRELQHFVQALAPKIIVPSTSESSTELGRDILASLWGPQQE